MVFRPAPDWQPGLEAMEQALAEHAWHPCSAMQEKSLGWVPPRGEAHGALVEAVAGQRMLRFMIETKRVPANVVRRMADEKASQIEASSGRQPGKRERRELAEDLRQQLLPQAFAQQAAVWVWIDLRARWVCTDAGSGAKVDDVLSALSQTFPGIGLQPVQTQIDPQAAMSGWLAAPADMPAHFVIGRECELKSSDEWQSVVRYTRHPLEGKEVRQHLAEGKRPTRLALNWDARVDLVLTEGLVLKKIAFLDGVFDADAQAEGESGFDADVALATGELGALLPDLLAALGGEAGPGQIAPMDRAAEDALA